MKKVNLNNPFEGVVKFDFSFKTRKFHIFMVKHNKI